jgi:hypothetical protein
MKWGHRNFFLIPTSMQFERSEYSEHERWRSNLERQVTGTLDIPVNITIPGDWK